MGGLLIFTIGVACGAGALVFHATRPNGYLANNGHRYRLTEVPTTTYTIPMVDEIGDGMHDETFTVKK